MAKRDEMVASMLSKNNLLSEKNAKAYVSNISEKDREELFNFLPIIFKSGVEKRLGHTACRGRYVEPSFF